jgi:hypothetical protein
MRQNSEVNGLGFSVGSTVRRRATDVMESGTAATQAEPIDFAADQPLGPPPAPHYRLLPIKTRVVSDAAVAAILAALDMPAERGRAALLDRRHHLELAEAHMPGIGAAPVGSMAIKDVGDLQPRAAHGRPVRSRVAASLCSARPHHTFGSVELGSSSHPAERQLWGMKSSPRR